MFLDGTDDPVPWTNFFFPAKLLTRTRFADGAGYRWWYTWKEQFLDPDTAGYLDLDGGREGTLTAGGDCLAVEVNDAPAPLLIVVPMRLRGIAAGGQQLFEFYCPPQTLMARITGGGSGGGADYSWVERDDSGDVTNGHDSDGTVGDMPAHEINGVDNVPIGTKVRLRLSENGTFYYFDHGNVLRVDDTTIDTVTPATTTWDYFLPISRIIVDRFTGVRAYGTSHLGPDATIKGIPASGTQQGMVSLGAQVMGSGDKTFGRDVYVGRDLFVANILDVNAYADIAQSITAGTDIAAGGDLSAGGTCFVQGECGFLSQGGSPELFTLEVRTGGVLVRDPLTVYGDVTVVGGDLSGPSANTLSYGIIDAADHFRCGGFDGVTGTGGGGDEFTGGICTTLGGGGSASIVIGTTPVTGGTPGDLMIVGTGPVVQQAGLGAGLSLSGGNLNYSPVVGTTTVTGATDGDLLYVGTGGVLQSDNVIDGGSF